jgi:putative membrane protein
VCTALIASGIAPHDRTTWLMEIFPVLIVLPLLIATHKRFSLTPLLYILITIHALGLIAGGAYSYARVPLGEWIQSLLDMDRNPYDKLGHFMQGFVPCLLAREILIRQRHVSGYKMLAFLSGCVAVAVSAVYEMIEWWAALALGQGADQFLGTQGYEWDTQSDMFYALIGAAVALVTCSALQDRQIRQLEPGWQEVPAVRSSRDQSSRQHEQAP